jgi:hypothetical protein
VPPLSFLVPSFEAVTPEPAVALLSPLGSTKAGHTFKHVAVHAVELALSVYSVFPLERTFAPLEVFMVEITTLFDELSVAAPALFAVTKGAAIPPMTRAAIATRRPENRSFILWVCLVGAM